MKFIKTLVLCVFVPTLSFAEIINLSDEGNETLRMDFIKNDKPVVRIQMGNIKDGNKVAGQGTVNIGIKDYQEKELEIFRDKFQKDHPDIKLKLYRTDFKGFAFTCEGSLKCDAQIESALKKRPLEIELKTGYKLPLTTARANSYSEAYMLTRAMQNYPDYDGKNPPLKEFLDLKLKEIVKTGTVSRAQLKKDVALMRRKGTKGISKKSLELINLIDTLEVPFQAANNLDKEFTDALAGVKATKLKNGMSVGRAQSGDDLYLVIKNKDGKVLKIVGADARGLGVVNMTARYDAFFKRLDSGNSINSIGEMVKLSNKGILKADKQMDDSMDTYRKVLINNLEEFSDTDNIDDFLNNSNNKYIALTEGNPDLMGMRAAAINKCALQECFDKMTVHHNLLKELEDLNVEHVFSNSCLGTQYWLKRVLAGKVSK